jgi:type I restriction enzyme, S subunit
MISTSTSEVPPDTQTNRDECTPSRDLPESWKTVRVGDVCSLVNGSAYKPSDWGRTGVPIVRIQNLNDHAKPFDYWAGSLEGRVSIKTGDVLLAWSGTPGTSFGVHIWRRGDAVLNQHIFRVDLTDPALLPEWFVYAANHVLHILIHKAHGGVGLRHVTKGEVERLELPLPPLPEQRRIIAILNGEMTALEFARAAAKEQLEAAKALPAAYLRSIFDNSEAQQWKRKRFEHLGALMPSKSIATDGDTEVTAITSACLTETGFFPSRVKTARMWADDAAECVASCGEILISRSNTSELVGRAAMFAGEPEGAIASDLTIRFLPHSIEQSPFISSYLSFLFLSGYWKERAGGASGSMKKITRKQIMGLSVPMPSEGEQKRITELILNQMASIKTMQTTLREQLNVINKLPKTLFAKH